MQEVNNVKIVTWNVNGIRSLYKDAASIKHGLDSLDADVICLQETKVTRSALRPDTALVDGYNSYFGFPRSKNGYSGVATYCKNEFTPFRAEEGLSGLFASSDSWDCVGSYGNIRAEFSKKELQELDFEGRAVITQHKIKVNDTDEKLLSIINVYCPRADVDNKKRMEIKLRFYDLLEVRTKALLDSGSFVIIAGDINTCHKPIDHCDPSDPEEFNKNPCRKWLNRIIYDPGAEEMLNDGNMNSFNLIDAFRFVNPIEENAFTCWNTQLNARSTNYGTRIDYILIDLRLGGDMDDCVILKDVLGSDHCPVKAIIDVKCLKSLKCPSFCSKHYPGFSGTQKRLSEFFGTVSECTSGESGSSHSKRKSNNSNKETKRQRGIAGFFQVKAGTSADGDDQASGNRSSMESVSSLSSLSEISPDSSESASDAPNKEDVTSSAGPSGCCSITAELDKKCAVEAWKNVLSGPKPAPKCNGHNEPCVLRRVKKKGSNYNRKFWTCARGEGRSGDPKAKCDHFQWDCNSKR